MKDLRYYGYEWAFSDDDHDDPCFEGYVPPSGDEGAFYAVITAKLLLEPSERGNGEGSKRVKRIIDEIRGAYPELPIRIAAYPAAVDTDMSRLIVFYERMKFERESRVGDAVIMVRYG